MITIKKRLSYVGERSIQSGVNAIANEIQAHLNRISIVRGTVTDPDSDYFRFDSDTSTLYLETLEGTTLEISTTEV